MPTSHYQITRHLLCARRAIVTGFSIATLLLSVMTPSYAQSTGAIMTPGNAAVTGFSGVISQNSGVSIDIDGPSVRVIKLPASGPFGLIAATKTFTVTAGSVGQVFGIALDNQPQPDIFVAATSAYGLA